MEGTIIGTCMEMCPASELSQHNNRNFEINPVTKEFDPKFAIKTFHRSDAGKKILASDVRPLPVLQKTMDHIINVVIGKLVGLTPGATEWNMAKFVRDIFRSIRQDITIQNLRGPEIIDMLEKMALFFIACGVKFLDEEEFDPTQNFEQVTQTLLSLDEYYDDYFAKTGKHSPNESEFRAAHLLVSITEDRFMLKIVQLPQVVLQSAAVKKVLDLRQAYNTNNLHQFVHIAMNSPLHLMCVAISSAKQFWTTTLKNFRIACKQFSLTKDFFKKVMLMGNKTFQLWEPGMGIEDVNGGFKFDIKKMPEIPKATKTVVPPKIRMKVDTVDFRTVFDLEVSGPQRDIKIPTKQNLNASTYTYNHTEEKQKDEIVANYQETIVHDNKYKEEKDEESSEEHSEEKSEEDEKEPQEAPAKIEEITSKVKEQEIKVKNYEPSHTEYPKKLPEPVHINLPTKRTQIIPADLSILSILPRELPERCFATIGINAGGDSESANFAIKRMRTDDPIIYCDEIHTRNSILYLLILRNDLLFHESPLGALIDCEEKNSLESFSNETKVFKFTYNSSASPYFNFDSILRSAIKAAVREITPYDITELFISGAASYLSSYQFSAYKKAFCDLITSSYFHKYLVPFDHKLISYNDLRSFVSAIQTADRNLDNFGIRQFLVPLDKSFSAEDFYSKITIIAEEDIIESSFDNILLEFLEDL